MSERTLDELSVGARLRQLREALGRAPDELARAAGLAGPRLAGIESGGVEPAIGELMALAAALGVPVGRFFESPPGSGRVDVVRADTRFGVTPPERGRESLGYRYQALTRGLGDRLMQPFLVEVPPGAPVDPIASRHDGEEFLFVLSGRLAVTVGGETHELGPGDSIYYDSRLEHVLVALERQPARLVACVAQAARPPADDPLSRKSRD